MRNNNDYPLYVPPVALWHRQNEQQNMEQQEQQQEPKTDPPKEPASTTDDETLGEGGKKALAAERAARVAAEKELKKFKDDADKRAKDELSEVDRLKLENTETSTQLTATQQELAKYKIGVEMKIDPALIKRLQGTTEDEIRADAAELVKLQPGTKVPKADPSQGRKTSSSGLSAKDEFADTVDSLFDRSSG